MGIDRKSARLAVISELFGSNFSNKDWVIEKYINQGWSLPDFRRECGVNYSSTLFVLDYHGIKRRTIRESVRSDKRRQKFENTCLQRYGVTNVSKLDDVKTKKATTFFEHYGEDNIWKTDEFKSNHSKLMLARYGKGSLSNRHGGLNAYWKELDDISKSERVKTLRKGFFDYLDCMSPEEKQERSAGYRERIYKRMDNGEFVVRSSKMEMAILDIVFRKYKDAESQKWIERKSYDLYVPSLRLIIEINGDYWHANPLLYKDTDVLKFPGAEVTASALWEKDERKRLIAKKWGYAILTLWENDIIRNGERLEEWVLEQIDDACKNQDHPTSDI